MSERTTPATPYQVLGVTASASTDELRRAYRRRLRETHPDVGGEAAGFHAVQVAWELIGTPEDRAAFDRGREPGRSAPSGSSFVPGSGTTPSWEQSPAFRPSTSAPASRSHGHPGGWNREQYVSLMREWVGRGAPLDNPFDEGLVRSAPRELRHLLADAIAEEDTARTLSQLGIEYTIWHDVDTDDAGPGSEQKLDHIVLGPTGLFAMLSEDWDGALQVRKGELVSDRLAVGERPVNSLSKRTRGIVRAARVKFTALAIVVPDGSTAESAAVVGKEKGVPVVIVQQSRLADFVRGGLEATPHISADELFAVRERLTRVIRFI